MHQRPTRQPQRRLPWKADDTIWMQLPEAKQNGVRELLAKLLQAIAMQPEQEGRSESDER